MKKMVRALSFVLVALMLFGILPLGDLSMIETAEADANDVYDHEWFYPIDVKNNCPYVTSTFGRGGSHKAIDIGTKNMKSDGKVPVYATEDGKIIKAVYNPNGDTGNYIVMYHEKYDVTSIYMHLTSFPADCKGKEYQKGEQIAIAGATGKYKENGVTKSYGAHLHFELIQGKITVVNYARKAKAYNTTPKYFNGQEMTSSTLNLKGAQTIYDSNNWRMRYTTIRHQHEYDKNGYCIADIDENTCCGFYFYSDENLDQLVKKVSGTATPASKSSSFPVYNGPYEASGKIQIKGFWDAWGKDLVLKQAEIDRKLEKNHADQEWYRIKTDKSPTGIGWVMRKDIEVTLNSEVTVTGVVAPENGASPGRSVMAVEGKVTTNNGAKLDRVVAAVFRADKLSDSEKTKLANKKYDTAAVLRLAEGNNSTSTKAFTYAHTENINAETFDLHKAYYVPLKFSQCVGGVKYIYVVYGTDNRGKTGYHYREFTLKSSSNAVTTYTVRLNVNGSETSQTVNKGQSITLPNKSRQGYVFRGWTDVTYGETAKYTGGSQYTPTGNVTLYAVFEEILPPAAPNLTAMTYDIAEGETQAVSWNAAVNATKYTVSVYNDAGILVHEQSTSGTTAAIPFSSVGTYTVYVEAFNDSLSGGSGQSAQCVTVRVHGPSTVTFENYDGSIWSVQSVPYNGTVERPTDPSRDGYTFSGWNGSFTNVKADRTITAKYTAIKYRVTFYDADGNVLSAQDVTYNEDTPGSATEPEAPEKENYTFVGWSTGDWQNVTTNGVRVYPVYVWANQDVPMTISITEVNEDGNGYWVGYIVENHGDEEQTGRVIIVGKTRQGKFITQTESGAFHTGTHPKDLYKTGSVYIPVNSSDMATMATIEAYVVDNYKTTKPISQPDSFLVGSIDGEYTAWMTENEYNAFSQPEGSTVETKTQYRKRDKETITTQTSTYLDWTLVSTSKRYGNWGNWSAWQDAAVTANDLRQIETRQVLVTEAHTEYRYGRWFAMNVDGCQSHDPQQYMSCPSYAHAKYNWKPIENFSKDFTAWSTTRYASDGGNIHTSLWDAEHDDKTWYQYVGGLYYWYRYYIGPEQTRQYRYWWEETRQVPATYKTQYRYRTRAEITDYTFEHWTDWSAWGDTEITGSSTQQVDTRTMYRVKLPTASAGTTYEFLANAGEAAANKQAILTVYKVDSASDYSNQYIEQVTLDGNGSHLFTFDTLEAPSIQTGDYTVTLTVEGATESLYIGTIEAPKPQYTVRFVDEITGDEINVQTVSQGSAAVAPDAPVHEGYSFLGWEYGLGNIREDMTIAARYVKKAYTVVFIDGVNLTVTVMNDIPYGEPVAAPEVEAPEGYNFIGWQTAEGMNLDTVTGHMIVTAEYEHLTHTVTYMSAVTGTDEEGNAIATVVSIQTINHGEYAEDPLGYDADYDEEENPDEPTDPEEPTEPDPSEEDPEIVDYENLNIPENMYFDGWSEGAEDPVTNDVIVTPVLQFFEDAAEVSASIEEGLYAGTQRITLMADAENVSGISVQYRLNNGDGEAEWLDYDLASAPEIEIAETCLLEIEVNEPDKNGYAAAYEYIIVPESEFPATPQSMDAAQTDTKTVTVNWTAVSGANGYMVRRVSDCNETAEFDVQGGTSFADGGVDPLRRYTYTVTAYKLAEKDGANVVLESQPTDEKTVFFFGDNTPVTNVEVTAPTTVIKGSATQLTASVTPDDAYDTTVIWTCTDGTGEGYVSSDGLFYGISAGTVTVTAKAFDGSEQYDSAEITVQEIDVGTATLTVSSAPVRAGGTATVNVSVSENSLAEAIQFAVLYDSTKLELTNCEAGAVIKNLSPVINSTEEGVIYFNWDSITSLTAGGSLLDLTFKVKADATGPAVIEIPTDNAEYEFLFVNGSLEEIDIATVSGVLDISELLLGDVDGSGKVNIIDANMIRRHAAKLITLEEEQLLAADVNGDGKVNIIDANLIRRYVAHLIDVFPAEN